MILFSFLVGFCSMSRLTSAVACLCLVARVVWLFPDELASQESYHTCNLPSFSYKLWHETPWEFFSSPSVHTFIFFLESQIFIQFFPSVGCFCLKYSPPNSELKHCYYLLTCSPFCFPVLSWLTFLHSILTFCTQFQLSALNFNFLHFLGLISVFSANAHVEIFACVLDLVWHRMHDLKSQVWIKTKLHNAKFNYQFITSILK